MFSTFTGSVNVACKVPYRYCKCSVIVCKFQKLFGTFTDSVEVTCKVAYR